MQQNDVFAIVDALDRGSVRYWVAGGWGVDALVGEVTRPHSDLDLCIDAKDEASVIEELEAIGFAITLDLRPVRFAMTDIPGLEVDVHPVVFGVDGTGVQAGPDGTTFVYPADAFAYGGIGHLRVPCLSALQQVRFHSGYERQGKDNADLALLRERLGIAIPE
jgi:lincosamide nucleotidyltransferase A/C/D/E